MLNDYFFISSFPISHFSISRSWFYKYPWTKEQRRKQWRMSMKLVLMDVHVQTVKTHWVWILAQCVVTVLWCKVWPNKYTFFIPCAQWFHANCINMFSRQITALVFLVTCMKCTRERHWSSVLHISAVRCKKVSHYWYVHIRACY